MAKRPVILTEVIRVEDISERFVRVWLQAEQFKASDIDLLKNARPGDYMKLCLPKSGAGTYTSIEDIDLSLMYKRSFSLRSIDRAQGFIAMDFVRHEPSGPAGQWLKQIQCGQKAILTGPGPVQGFDHSAKFFVAMADMTGIPAAVANVEALPVTAKGVCFFEVPSEGDRLSIQAPNGVMVHWIIREREQETQLPALLNALDWDPSVTSFWAASEYSAVKELKSLLKPFQLSSDRVYISSYWKINASDEEHKKAKKTPT